MPFAGRSPTRMSVVSVNDDYDAALSDSVMSTSPPNNRLNPLKNPSTPRIHVSDNNNSSSQSQENRWSREHLPRKAQVLNLGAWRVTFTLSCFLVSLETIVLWRKLVPDCVWPQKYRDLHARLQHPAVSQLEMYTRKFVLFHIEFVNAITVGC